MISAENELPDDAELPSATVRPPVQNDTGDDLGEDPSLRGKCKDYAVIVRIRGHEGGYLTGHSVQGAESNLERAALISLAVGHLRSSLPQSKDS